VAWASFTDYGQLSGFSVLVFCCYHFSFVSCGRLNWLAVSFSSNLNLVVTMWRNTSQKDVQKTHLTDRGYLKHRRLSDSDTVVEGSSFHVT